jgi:hypothetical protein
MTAFALALLALLPVAAPAARTGKVLSATEARAYLDVGAEEGLAPGAVVELLRHGRPSGTCRVEEVSDHHAACAGSGLQAGDVFALPARPEVKAAELPALPTGDEQARRRAAVEAAPLALVDYAPGPGAVSTRASAEASLAYLVWASNVASGVQQGRFDGALRGMDLGSGLSLNVDLRALYWTQGAGTTFLPGPSAQLLVWQAEVDWRDPAQRYAVAAGRVVPWLAPGATVLDGAQAGVRIGPGEAGVFAGLVPDPWTTSPSTERYTGGAYWSAMMPSGKDLYTTDVRVAVVHTPELSTRIETELRGGAFIGRAFDVSGDLRLGLGSTRAPAAIDLAQVNLGARPSDAFRLGASFGYVGLTVPGDLPLRAIWPGPSRRGDADMTFQPSASLGLSILAGFAQDVASGVERGWVGPSVSLPRLLGRMGGLSLGVLGDFGWLGGFEAWALAQSQLSRETRLSARVSYSQERRPGLTGAPDQTIGLTVGFTADLSHWLAFRVSVLARSGVDFGGLGGYGASALASLAGRY